MWHELWKRSALTAFVLVLAGTSLLLSDSPAAATDPTAVAFADGIEDLSARLDDLSLLDSLNQPLPLTGLGLAERDGLNLGSLFQDSLGAAAANFETAFPAGGMSELAEHLTGITDVGGVNVSVTTGDASFAGTITTMDVTVVATRGISPRLDVESGDLLFFGGEVPINLSATVALTLQHDSDPATDPGDRFRIVGEPVVAFAASDPASGAPSSIASFLSRVGITDVTVSGDYDLDLQVAVQLLDPDGDGLITIDEWTNTTIIDLTSSTVSGMVDADLDFDSPLVDPNDGTLAFSDDLSDGPDIPPVDLDGLAPFARVNAAELLNGLAQFGAALDASQRVADLELPLLSGTLGDALPFSSDLAAFIHSIGDAAIVCGADESDPPLGDISRVGPGDTVFCQAVSLEPSEPGTVTWHANGAAVPGLAGGDTHLTVGPNPTSVIPVTLGATGVQGISVEFDDEDGSPHSVAQRFQTFQEMVGALAAAGIGVSDDDIAFDPATLALTLHLLDTRDFGPARVGLDVGSSLIDDTRLAGLSAGPGGGADVSATDVQRNATFGVLLVESPDDVTPAVTPEGGAPASDRFYIAAPSPVFLADASVVADLEMLGRIGFVAVTTTGNTSAPSPYMLIRTDPDEPMLAVSILVPGIEIGTGESTTNVPSAILLNDLLTDVGPKVSAAVNASMSASMLVQAPDADISGYFAQGVVDVSSNIATGATTVTPDADFLAQLEPLDIDPGTPDALRDLVLDSLVGLGNQLGAVSDADVVSPLPVIGLSPSSVTGPQLAELRRAVAELRTGPPVAVTCGTQDTLPPAGNAVTARDGDQIYCVARTFKPATSAEWVVTGLTPTAGAPTDALDTVGTAPTANMAWDLDDEEAGFSIALVFTDADGVHTAVFPDSTPTSLQGLEIFLESRLGLGADALQISVQDVTPPGGPLALVVALDYGVCTTGNSVVAACSSAQSVVPQFPGRLIIDTTGPAADPDSHLGDFGGLIALSESATLPVQLNSNLGLHIGVPLDPAGFDAGDEFALGTSVMTFEAGVDADAISVTAALGSQTAAVTGLARLAASVTTTPDDDTFAIGPFAHTTVVAGPAVQFPPGECGAGASTDACASLSITIGADDATTVVFSAPDIADASDWSAPIPAGSALFTTLSTAVLDWTRLTDPVYELGAIVARQLDGRESGHSAPLVGTVLDGGAEVATAIDDILFGLSGLPAILQAETDASTPPDEFEDIVLGALGGLEGGNRTVINPAVSFICGGPACSSSDDASDITEVRISFVLDSAKPADPDAETPFDLGLPGLPFEATGVVDVAAGWQLTVDFGLSRFEGPFLVVGGAGHADPELTIDLDGSIQEALAGYCGGIPSEVSAQYQSYSDDRCMPGKLGFYDATVWDGDGSGPDDSPSTVNLQVTVDIDGPSDRLRYAELAGGQFTPITSALANANVDLLFYTGDDFAGAQAPTMAGTFHYEVAGGVVGRLEYAGLRADRDSFESNFLGPVVSNIADVASPLKPVVDTIETPLPVLSDLAEMIGEDPVSMASLLGGDDDLTLLHRLSSLISASGSIDDIGSGLVGLGNGGDPGSFAIDAAVAAGAPQGATNAARLFDDPGSIDFRNDLLSALGGGSDAAAAYGIDGFSVPVLSSPEGFYGLLLGRDQELTRFDGGSLEATASMSLSYGPLFVGPVPLEITVAGSAKLTGRFSMGHNTSGLRMSFGTGSGGKLIQGVFINDLDAAGNDVPEITILGEFKAAAGVTFFIVSAGVEGGVRMTVLMDLDDAPVQDGVLTIDEVMNRLDNPICLFNTSGSLEAFLNAYVKISFLFYKKTFGFSLAKVTLLDFTNECDPQKPELAIRIPTHFRQVVIDVEGVPTPQWQDEDQTIAVVEPVGYTLQLNMGPLDRREARKVAIDEINESFVVRQLSHEASLTFEAFDVDGNPIDSGGTVGAYNYSVAAFGIYQEFDDIVQIDALADDGNDLLSFEAGISDDDELIPFEVPVHVSGGPGNDRITTGNADDIVYGGTGRDRISTGLGNDVVYGGASPDDPLTDEIDLGDVLNGELGDDTLYGGDGNDTLIGGAGADSLHGQDGSDDLLGGPGTNRPSTVLDVNPDPTLDRADVLVGGPGDDSLEGHWGDDLLYGDDELAPALCDTGSLGDDQVSGDFGNDTIVGGPGNDILSGEGGEDTIWGCAGDDFLDGDDDLPGTTDYDDQLHGGAGADEVRGRGGNDDIFGDDGDDLRIEAVHPVSGLPVARGGLYGGPGNDYISGGNGMDWIDGETGNDAIAGDTTVFNRDAAVDLTACSDGGAADTVSGGVGDDLICGEGGPDTIDGNAGNDQVRGNAGDDMIRGSEGDDLAWGDSGSDNMFGDSGADRLYGGTEDDVIRGGIGDDYIEGNSGSDELWGGADQDDIVGGSAVAGAGDGNDTVYGLAQSDVIGGDNALITRPGGVNAFDGSVIRSVTLLTGGDGSDLLYGAGGFDRLFGQGGNDTIRGGNEDDFIEGGPGPDSLYGDAGQDDIIGGSSAGDGVIDDARDGSGAPDSSDTIEGGDDQDVIAGDNAWISRPLTGAGTWVIDTTVAGRVVRSVKLFDVATATAGTFGDDDVTAGAGEDIVFGQHGDDTISGGDGDDYLEAGGGSDTVWGGDGQDDITGGSSASDGVIDGDRDGAGVADGHDVIHGDDGADVIAGDNARVLRPLDAGGAWVIDPNAGGVVVRDVSLFDVNSVTADVAGNDAIHGDAARDLAFGQGGADEVHGGDGDDYVEGNAGDDSLTGDGGEDDLIGGGSALGGAISSVSIGDGLLDGSDSISGGDGVDFIAGDNARVTRPAGAGGLWLVDPNAGGFVRRDVLLFDVNDVTSGLAGDDAIAGDGERDVMFGQAGSDTVNGNGGDDYIEGNAGADSLHGDDDDDDLTGGGSSVTGAIFPASDGNGLLDAGDTITGDAGFDVVAGDNARITRPTDSAGIWLSHPLYPRSVEREVQLFDVQVSGEPYATDTFGGDSLAGGNERDILLGQGGNDSIDAGPGDDYAEGNHGDDSIGGRDGQDDLIGGSSSGNGLIFGPLAPQRLLDGADAIGGDGDHDVIAGDNAWVLMTYDAGGAWITDPNTGAFVRRIVLFDVAEVASAPAGGTSGVDTILAGEGRDLAFGQGSDDTIGGGEGDDYLEGNAGSDTIHGDGGEDDIAGGSGAGTSLEGGAPGSVYLGGVSPEDLSDAGDNITGDGDDDVIVGDNATITRPVDGLGLWLRLDGFGFDIVVRNVAMAGAPPVLESPGAFGDDNVSGGDGHDDIYGQLGSDLLAGDNGEDAIAGDLGLITKNIIGDGVDDTYPANTLIAPEQPFFETTIYPTGQLFREVELFHFVTGDTRNGDDILLGGADDDWIHGGAGNDIANGNGGVDRTFGGDDNDVLWGGPGDDFTLGGHGEDSLDIKPRLEFTSGSGGNALNIPADPDSWFLYGSPDNYQDADFIYGGWDRDVMQANDNNSTIGPGGYPPNDRLVDWVGVYNLYLVCEPLYGDWIITRAISPGMLEFLQDLASGMGAVGVTTDDASGFRELGLVFAGKDSGANAGKAHPGTPGHFVCDDNVPVIGSLDEPTPAATPVASGSTSNGGGKGKK